MSMSQEEIEALMSGIDIEDNTNDNTITEEINDSKNDSVEDNFDDILAGIDGITDNEPPEAEDNFDDILAGIDGITDDNVVAAAVSSSDTAIPTVSEEIVDDNKKDNENKYPYPVEQENKVVSQLNEVAEDSEEKASQIFDVLSFILDENNEIQSYNKEMKSFISMQVELLSSLSTKFPNIDAFNENLELANKVLLLSDNLSSKVDGENNKLFEAMELMQYHDINRQKIERVMAVIRKLNSYLNGIFEDESDKPEIQIAKHISGDSGDTVDDDDLDALIAEFGDN